MKTSRRRLFVILLLVGVGMVTWIAQILPGVGQGPSNEELQEYASSKNFDPERGTFVNRRHDEYEQMMNGFDFVKLF